MKKKNNSTIDDFAADFCRAELQLENLKSQKKDALDTILELDPESENGRKVKSNLRNINESIDLLESRILGLKKKMADEAERTINNQLANYQAAAEALETERKKLEISLSTHLAGAMVLAGACKFPQIRKVIESIFRQPGGFDLDDDLTRLQGYVQQALKEIPEGAGLHQRQADVINLSMLRSNPTMIKNQSQAAVASAIGRARKEAV